MDFDFLAETCRELMIAISKEMNELMEMAAAAAAAEEALALFIYIGSKQTMQFTRVFHSFPEFFLSFSTL